MIDLVDFVKRLFAAYVHFARSIWRVVTSLAKKLSFLEYAGVVLLVVIAALSFAPVLHIPGNFKSLVVLSGSMEPKIHVGSVVVVKPAPTYAVGDIVTFPHPTSPADLITHRIESIENGVIKTKGDANKTPDNWEVAVGDVVGQVRFSIPYLGYAVNFAKTPKGFVLFIILPALLIIFNEILAIKREIEKGYEKKFKEAVKAKGGGASGTALAAIFTLFSLAVSTGTSWALFSDTEKSTGNTITVGVWASPGDVVINELMWMGSSGDSDDEWLELRNTTGAEIDIGGWQLTKWVSGDHEELMLTIPDGRTIPANGYFLISRLSEAVSAISVGPDLVDSSVVLRNDDLQIKLYRGDWTNSYNLIDTADDGDGSPLAGDNGSIKKSMERNADPDSGWHNCDDSSSTGLYWDSGATEQGTPGALNLDPTAGLDAVLLGAGDGDSGEEESPALETPELSSEEPGSEGSPAEEEDGELLHPSGVITPDGCVDCPEDGGGSADPDAGEEDGEAEGDGDRDDGAGGDDPSEVNDVGEDAVADEVGPAPEILHPTGVITPVGCVDGDDAGDEEGAGGGEVPSDEEA